MSIGRIVLWISLVAGCIEPQLKPCGDLLCAADSVCLPSGQCATQESIDVCVGVPEEGACTTAVFTGSCVMGVCTAPRCGDGVISGSEQCDGPVAGVDCVDYGFDTGVPTCSALCGLDVVGSCVRFGWERLFSDSVYKAWTDGTHFAFITSDRMHVRLYNGTQLIQEATSSNGDLFRSIDGKGTTVAVASPNSVLHSDAGGPFVAIDVSMVPNSTDLVAVGDDGTVYVGEFPSTATRVYRSTSQNTLEKILDSPTPSTTLMWRFGTLFVGHDDGNVEAYTPGGWTSFVSAPSVVVDIAQRPGGGYYIATIDLGAYIYSGTLTQFLRPSYPQLLPLGSQLFIGGIDNVMLRGDLATAGGLEELDCPILGDLMSDGTDLYIAGNGVYRFSGMEYTRRPGSSEFARDITLLADGEVAMVTQTDIQIIDSYDSWNFQGPSDLPLAIAGASGTDYYVTEGYQLEHSNGTTFSVVTTPNGIPDILDVLWDPATSTLYAVGAQGLAMKLVGTAWTMLSGISGCDVHQLAAQNGVVYAAGTCGTEGAIWKLSGTAWTELHRGSTPLEAMWVDASENIYAAGPTGGYTQIAGMWKDEPHARGASISATSPSDIWVGGGPEDLQRWNGSTWSRVRIVGAATPHVLATPRAVYIVGASTSVLIR